MAFVATFCAKPQNEPFHCYLYFFFRLLLLPAGRDAKQAELCTAVHSVAKFAHKPETHETS